MSTQVYASSIGVTLPEVAAVPLDRLDLSCPLPRLTVTGQARRCDTPVWILDNDFSAVTVAPTLGGRIIAFVDKCSGEDVLGAEATVKLHEGGVRGVVSYEGVQIFHPEGRPNALGQVEFFPLEPAEEGGRAALFLREGIVGTSLDWHACLSLAADRSDLLVELRVFNRALFPAVCRPCLFVGGLMSAASGEGWAAFESSSGTLVVTWGADPRSQVERVSNGPNGSSLFRSVGEEIVLGPRESMGLNVRLSAFGQMQGLSLFHEGVAAQAVGKLLRVRTGGPPGSARIGVLDANKDRFEATVPLDPGQPFLEEFPAEIRSLSLLDTNGNVLSDSESGRQPSTEPIDFVRPLHSEVRASLLRFAKPESDLESLESAVFASFRMGNEGPAPPPGLESATDAHRAARAAQRGDWQEAARLCERALSFNAEDPLLWWLRGLVRRHSPDQPDDTPELVNARFLAPLEPCLRAEAFLSTPVGVAPGPSPLVKPLAASPDDLLEVVHQLVGLGQFGDAARLMEESLRFEDVPLVRYLLAWCLMTQASMPAEAANHVRAVEGTPVAPPFPWRDIELAAVVALADRFPKDTRLSALCSLLPQSSSGAA